MTVLFVDCLERRHCGSSYNCLSSVKSQMYIHNHLPMIELEYVLDSLYLGRQLLIRFIGIFLLTPTFEWTARIKIYFGLFNWQLLCLDPPPVGHILITCDTTVYLCQKYNAFQYSLLVKGSCWIYGSHICMDKIVLFFSLCSTIWEMGTFSNFIKHVRELWSLFHGPRSSHWGVCLQGGQGGSGSDSHGEGS